MRLGYIPPLHPREGEGPVELENNAGKDSRHEQRNGVVSTCAAVKWMRTPHPGREVFPLAEGRGERNL